MSLHFWLWTINCSCLLCQWAQSLFILSLAVSFPLACCFSIFCAPPISRARSPLRASTSSCFSKDIIVFSLVPHVILHCLNGLYPFFMGYANYCGLKYRRMFGKYIFNLCRIDILPSTNNHIFFSVWNVQKPVFIEFTHIPCKKPPIPYSFWLFPPCCSSIPPSFCRFSLQSPRFLKSVLRFHLSWQSWLAYRKLAGHRRTKDLLFPFIVMILVVKGNASDLYAAVLLEETTSGKGLHGLWWGIFYYLFIAQISRILTDTDIFRTEPISPLICSIVSTKSCSLMSVSAPELFMRKESSLPRDLKFKGTITNPLLPVQ